MLSATARADARSIRAAAIARNFLSKLEERDYDLMHPGWMDPTQNLRLRLPFMLMKHRVLGKF